MFSEADYAAFRRMSREERLRAFGAMPPADRAELFRIQVRTFLEAHRPDLSAEQIAVLEENIAFLRPELYEEPRNEELRRQKEDLIRRTTALFDLDQLAGAMFLHGADIPEFSVAELEIRFSRTAGTRIDLVIIAARMGDATARVRIHAASPSGERIVDERVVLLRDPPPPPRPAGVPDPPRHRIRDVVAELPLRDDDERLRVTIAPVTPGVRLWAAANVFGADGALLESIAPSGGERGRRATESSENTSV